MNSRTIDLNEETYKKLLAVKKEEESIGELINRLIAGKEQKTVTEDVDLLNLTEEEWKKIKQTVEEMEYEEVVQLEPKEYPIKIIIKEREKAEPKIVIEPE